jgi:hypothetical protein
MFGLEWHSILVSATIPEGGAKNPSKGISMKFLVLAFDAQSGAISGSKKDGAIHNGMWALTLPSWRLVILAI